MFRAADERADVALNYRANRRRRWECFARVIRSTAPVGRRYVSVSHARCHIVATAVIVCYVRRQYTGVRETYCLLRCRVIHGLIRESAEVVKRQ